MRAASAVLLSRNNTLLQEWNFEDGGADLFVKTVNHDGDRKKRKERNAAPDELEREYSAAGVGRGQFDGQTAQQLKSGPVSNKPASASLTSTFPAGAASLSLNSPVLGTGDSVLENDSRAAALTDELLGGGKVVHRGEAPSLPTRQHYLTPRPGTTGEAAPEVLGGMEDLLSLQLRYGTKAVLNAEEATKNKTRGGSLPKEQAGRQEETDTAETDWQDRLTTPRGRRLMAAAVMGLANAFDQFARLGGALCETAGNLLPQTSFNNSTLCLPSAIARNVLVARTLPGNHALPQRVCRARVLSLLE